MKDTLIQSGLCFITTLVTAYLLASTDFSFISVLGLVVVSVCLGMVMFYTKKILLGGVLAGALAGTINIESLFSTDSSTWTFLILASVLALLTGSLYLGTMSLSEKLNLRELYGNGGTLPLIAFVAGLLFLLLGQFGLDGQNITFLRNGDIFIGTDVWHFLILIFVLAGTYYGYRLNKQSEGIYNQYSLLIVAATIYAVGSLIPSLFPFHGVEMAIGWVAGIFIGLTRLEEFATLKQYLAAAVVFGVFYILFRNVLPDLPMMLGVIAFLAVFTIQKIAPSNQPQTAPVKSNELRGNLSNVEAYYQSK